MATISKRNNKWQVQVRHLGHNQISKTFLRKQEAEQWARELEALQYANVGQGILAGIAILFCALILDRIVQGKKRV